MSRDPVLDALLAESAIAFSEDTAPTKTGERVSKKKPRASERRLW